MRRHPRREIRAIAHALDHARHKRRAVQLAHFLGHADVLVHQRLVVVDHVLVRRLGVRALLEPVCLSVEEVQPYVLLDEVEEGDDVERAELVAGDFAVEEEVEELETDGVALDVESRDSSVSTCSLAIRTHRVSYRCSNS